MATVEAAEEVNLPVEKTYELWNRFESFPHFMEGIESVQRLSDDQLEFTGNLYGHKRSWKVRIVDQDPPTRIAWRGLEGAKNDGEILFDPITPRKTRVALTVDFEPETVTERIGEAMGLVDARVRGDLGRFREFAEGGPEQRQRREERAHPPPGGEPPASHATNAAR